MGPRELSQKLQPAVHACLIAQACALVHRERVDAIQRRILQTGNWLAEKSQEKITDPNHTYLMPQSDYPAYFTTLRKALEADGYVIQTHHINDNENYWDYYCPACLAESIQSDAEHVLINLFAEYLNYKDFLHKLLSAGMDDYRKLIDLLVRFVVNSPDYVSPVIPKNEANQCHG